MPPRQPRDHYHLSLSIGKALWDDLVGAALPYRVGDGQFDVGKLVYQGAKQLQVKEKVGALLDDKNTPPAVAPIANMPELGSLDAKASGMLAGLAPVASDSGQRNGPRRIRGGRAEVRTGLYKAAHAAARSVRESFS